MGRIPPLKPIRKLLVANRGEIARRIIRTCDRLGIVTVAVYSDADRDAPHVREAREAVRIGEAPARDSYLRIDRMIEAARRTGADAVHPGYGFLSENAEFAEACAAAGLIFIGPRPETMRAMASKIEARAIAERAGVAVIPSGTFPLMVKAAAGGGGKGMRRVDRPEELEEAKASAAREAEAAFGDGTLLIESYIAGARHIEVQLLGDGRDVVAIGDRECSLQRRHQKIVEEAPAPNISDETRGALRDAAVRIGKAVGYVSAGTIEFLLAPSGEFYFLEMNTRIQVEHPVTELATGLDLVAKQISIAEGDGLKITETPQPCGHAIEARLYAEDPAHDFLPSTGKILQWRVPYSTGRIDSGIEEGSEVSIHYDPMLAKFISFAADRQTAIGMLRGMIERTVVHGVVTNREFLIQILDHPDFINGCVTTDWSLDFRANTAGESEARAVLDAYLQARAQQQRRILPSIPAGYRNNPLERRNSPVRLLAAEPRHVRAEIDGVQRSYDFSEDEHHYWIGDRVFPRVSRYPPEDAAASAESASSPMPGKVLRILVETGANVRPGDPLVILEAMKMEQTVRAHAAGVVDAVLVAPGEVIAPGQMLVRFEPKETQ